MPKKIQEGKKLHENEKEEEQSQSELCECPCGATFKGVNQVYKHIQGQHKGKKEYKDGIVNPNKRKQKIPQLRGSWVETDKEQSQFYDLTFETMREIQKRWRQNHNDNIMSIKQQTEEDEVPTYDFLKEVIKDAHQQFDSQSFNEHQTFREVKKEGSEMDVQRVDRSQKIREEMQKLMKNNEIIDWKAQFNTDSIYDIITLKRYQWNILSSLSGFFKINFAAKAELSLILIYISNTHKLQKPVKQHLQRDINKIWSGQAQIIQVLNDYCQAWIHLAEKVVKDKMNK